MMLSYRGLSHVSKISTLTYKCGMLMTYWKMCTQNSTIMLLIRMFNILKTSFSACQSLELRIWVSKVVLYSLEVWSVSDIYRIWLESDTMNRELLILLKHRNLPWKVPCCDVRYYFLTQTMFGSYLPPVIYKRAHVLHTLFTRGLMSYIRYLQEGSCLTYVIYKRAHVLHTLYTRGLMSYVICVYLRIGGVDHELYILL